MARCEDCLHFEVCQALEQGNGIMKVHPLYCGFYKPTADVAPRAEVDKAYWEGVEYGHKDGAALVAREIFEEIKDQLRGIFDFFRQDNDIRESCAIMFAISEVDKIEKKYTQPEPPEGD